MKILLQAIGQFQKISIPILRIRVILMGEVVSRAEMMERGEVGGRRGEATKKDYKFGFNIFWIKNSIC